MNDRFSNIVLFSLQGIGNALLALPLAAALKSRWPDAKLTLLVISRRLGNVCIEHPAIDEVMFAGKSHLQTLRTLRSARFDLAVFSFPSAWRSHLFARLAQIPERAGHLIPQRRAFGLTTAVEMIPNAHDLDQNFALAKALGARGDLENFWPPLFDIPERFVHNARAYLESQGLDPDGRYLGIHTGSDSRYPEKRYPPEKFAEVARIVYEKTGLPAIVFDGPAEPGTGMQVAKATSTPVHALAGWGDMTNAWGLMKFCDLFVSNDSGLMNLASAAGLPTVGIFGPSLVYRARPYRGEFVKSDWACSPCYTLNHFSGCVSPDGFCLDHLPPEQVAMAAMKVLGR